MFLDISVWTHCDLSLGKCIPWLMRIRREQLRDPHLIELLWPVLCSSLPRSLYCLLFTNLTLSTQTPPDFVQFFFYHGPCQKTGHGVTHHLNEQTSTDMFAKVHKHCEEVKISRHYGVGHWVCAVLTLVLSVRWVNKPNQITSELTYT